MYHIRISLDKSNGNIENFEFSYTYYSWV